MLERFKPWVLLLSLLINAALVGFVVAQFMRGGPPRMAMRPHEPFERGGPNFEGREILDTIFKPEQPKMEETMKDMVKIQRRIDALLRAETVDLPAFEAALDSMKAANTQAAESLNRAMQGAAKLDLAQRKKLAEALERMPPPGPRRGGPGGPGGPGDMRFDAPPPPEPPKEPAKP